jgi:hypothetical protein
MVSVTFDGFREKNYFFSQDQFWGSEAGKTFTKVHISCFGWKFLSKPHKQKPKMLKIEFLFLE